jgi:hypothetical protein
VLGQGLPQHLEGLLLVAGDQHPLALGHEVADQVGDGVGLAGAWRALDGDATELGQAAADLLLLGVARQRQQQPPGRAGHAVGRPAGGDHAGQGAAGEPAGGGGGRRALVEAAVGDRPAPHVEHRGRPEGGRLPGGRGRAVGEQGDLGPQHVGDVAEQLPGPGHVPRVDGLLAQAVAQLGEGVQPGQPEPVQERDLERGRGGRAGPDLAPVGVDLDRHGRHQQRVEQPLPADGPAEDAVAPDQLEAGLVLPEAQGEVPQVAVEAGARRGAGPGAPDPAHPVVEPGGGEVGARRPGQGGRVEHGRDGRVVEPAAEQLGVDRRRAQLGSRRLLADDQPGILVAGGVTAPGQRCARVGHQPRVAGVGGRADPQAGDGGELALPEQLLPAGGDVADGPVEHRPDRAQVPEEPMQPLGRHLTSRSCDREPCGRHWPLHPGPAANLRTSTPTISLT